MLPDNNRHYTAVFQHPDSHPLIRVEGNCIIISFDSSLLVVLSLEMLPATSATGYWHCLTLALPGPQLTSAAAMPLIDAYWPFS